MDSHNGSYACINSLEENGDSVHHHPSKKPKPSVETLVSLEDDYVLAGDEFSHHEKGIARINNGSFGSCPGSILAEQFKWQKLYLQQPDKFYFDHLKPGILRSRTVIADLINAPHVDEVSIVDNATTAAAIVLQQVAWSFIEKNFDKGDAVVMLHYAYGAVKKSIQAYVARAGGFVIEVQLPFPVKSNDEIIFEFRKALEKGKASGRKVRLAVIDHITSMPSVVIPVKELVRICREEAVDQVFVDAAHAIGNVEIDVQEIDADFYTSNLHKWFFCPPSVALLYCRESRLRGLHHPVVSHEYGNGLAIESAWIGTRDYSAQLVVPSVLDFVKKFKDGIDGIRRRNHDNVVAMGQMLVKSWGTNLGSPPEMCSSMIMVGLPASLKISSDGDALKLRTHLRDSFGVEVPIYYLSPKRGENEEGFISGYARISYQVYNSAADYYRLRDAINQLVAEGTNCATLPCH